MLDEIGRDSTVKIQRYKGLGEMDAEQLWDTTMKPETRILKKVVIDDGNIEMVEQTFSTLMGENVERRKEFIENHAKYAVNVFV